MPSVLVLGGFSCGGRVNAFNALLKVKGARVPDFVAGSNPGQSKEAAGFRVGRLKHSETDL